MKNIILRLFTVLVVLLCGMFTTGYSQVTMSGNFVTHADSLIGAMPTDDLPDMDKYQIPTTLEINTFGNAIVALMNGNYSAANDSAAKISYRVIKFIETTVTPSPTYYVLEKTTAGTNYWGAFALNPNPSRGKLFIQSPHPLYDSNTGLQGALVFRNTGARAWFVSGTHRCNSGTNTTCSGTTDVCGGDYKMSDQAHVVNGTLYRATLELNTFYTQMIVIQNHGFGKSTGDPDVIMGNGKTSNPTGTDWLVAVRDGLAQIDNTLEFKVGHIDTDWTTLTGTTNTQGRYINGSASPCNTAPSSANGRFLHLEQAKPKLRDTEANRKKLSDAIIAAMPADGLTLTSPNGGENLTSGSSQNITWSSTGLISNVKLEYSVNNGTTWIVITSSTANDGSYTLTVPNIGTWRAKIRISDESNSSVGDTSNAVFKIMYTVFPTTGTTTYVDPAAAFGSRKLSGVYDFHRGIDFPNALNTPIRPARPGVIVRREDTTITASSGLSRNGNWILVKIDNISGQSAHNAYLHMNSFNMNYNIGDTVSTQDTIGFMGKSGYQINTIHLHLELYKNLSGTSIDKDKAKNPMEMLPYINSNSYTVSYLTSNDSTAVQFETPDTEIDFDAISIYGSLATRTIAYNARTGIDPVDNDNPSYNNVRIDPDPFILDSATQRLRFWVKNSEIGTIDSVNITDVSGYSFTVSEASLGYRYAVATGNWNGSIWAASPGGVAGSASTPTSLNDITINSAVTVTVNVNSAECKSVLFGSTTSKLSFSAGSMLSVYGDFALASTSHNAFSSWAGGAKLRFSGNNTQTISGFGDFNSTNSSFKELQVYKSGGVLQTPGAASGNGMSINVVDTLDVISGTFVLGLRDDIQGRSLTGTPATTPVIIVRNNGTFTMSGSASHIRSGNVSASSTPIGKMFIYGIASLATTSSNGINFSNIDVYDGGSLTFESFSSSQPNNLKPGTVQVLPGATLINNSTIDFWNASSNVALSNGGVYKVGASTTVFPPTFTNSGKVQYARTGEDGSQTITDMNYSSLSIASNGIKSWNLASARTISDTLEILDGTLNLTSSSKILSVQNVLKLQNDTIVTGTNTLALGTSTSNSGALNYTAGIIIGNFQRWFSASTTNSTLFPVGSSTKLRPAAVSFTSAPSIGGTLTAAFIEELPGTNGLPLSDEGTSIVNSTIDGYWSMVALNGLSGGVYSLALTATGLSGVSDYTSLRILKRQTGESWTLQGTHEMGIGSNGSPTVRRIGMSGFSEFTIGSAVDNPLPVELIEFKGATKNLSVVIEWKTATEHSNMGFDIERKDFDSWAKIGFERGAGNSNSVNNYSFTDQLAISGKYSYRLKQIDYNGEVKYSSEIAVEAGMMPLKLKLFQNYPNPFNPKTTLQFTLPVDGLAILNVYNTTGQLVTELFRENVKAGWLQQVQWDASTLPSGIYFIRLNTGKETVTSKILLMK